MVLKCKSFVVVGSVQDLPVVITPPVVVVPKEKPKFGCYCSICSRKVSIGASVGCRCGLRNLCSKHRYPEDHACSFNFKTLYAPVIGLSIANNNQIEVI
jgi:hypothetical protein